MFSFFKKRRYKQQQDAKDQRSNSDEQQEQERDPERLSSRAQTERNEIYIPRSGLHKEQSENTTASSSGANSQHQSPQTTQLSQHNSSPTLTNNNSSVQQKVFIEYTVQKEESLQDICDKFVMEKGFFMELNQIWDESDIPSVVVVQATPIQQQIIRTHALKEETIQIIQKNTTLLSSNEGVNQNNSNGSDILQQQQEEADQSHKKLSFFANLEKNEEFPMKLVTSNGIIKGVLIINSFMAHFSPEVKDFKRLQNDIELLKKKKAYKHHKFMNNQLSDYSLTLDINDIFMADINVVEALDAGHNSSSSNHHNHNSAKPKKMEVLLDLFLTRVQNFVSDGQSSQFLKVEFLSTETFQSKDLKDSENIGRTYVHYVLQKLQYLIGKTRSKNEAINQFTDDFSQTPSQSIVKHYQVVSNDFLKLMNLDSDSVFSTDQNNPPKLEHYPSLVVDGSSLLIDPTEGDSIQSSSEISSPLTYRRLLSKQQFEQIVDRLPCYLQLNDWHLIYSPIKHGSSYEQMLKRTNDIGPHVIIIKDLKHKYIFGAFVTEGWSKAITTTYGSAESFLFSFKKNPDNYQRLYQNILWYRNRQGSTHIQFCNEQGIAVGIDTKFALFIHHTLNKGTTHSTRLMQNDLLTESSDFKIDHLEIWGLDRTRIRTHHKQS